MLAAGTWILGQIAEEAVADYYVYHGHDPGMADDDMLRRLRVDLDLMECKIVALQ